jgi:hypothetical protein
MSLRGRMATEFNAQAAHIFTVFSNEIAGPASAFVENTEEKRQRTTFVIEKRDRVAFRTTDAVRCCCSQSGYFAPFELRGVLFDKGRKFTFSRRPDPIDLLRRIVGHRRLTAAPTVGARS